MSITSLLLIDFIISIKEIFLIGIGLVILSLIPAISITVIDGFNKYKPYMKKHVIISIIILSGFCIIPSERTLYLILGANMSESFLSSELGHKLQALLDSKINKLLEKDK